MWIAAISSQAMNSRTRRRTRPSRLLARTEGLLTDPVYTGKALAGLIDHVRTGRVAPGETVVFWHTGGATALFAEQAILGDLAKK